MDKIDFKKKILIVDDEEHFLDSASFVVSSINDVDVITCSESSNVFNILYKSKVDVILLDINMPVKRGDQLVREILEKYPELSIIMVSAINEVKKAVECIKSGAADYLVKPFKAETLIGAINRILKETVIRDENQRLKSSLLSGKLSNPENFKHIVTQNSEMLAIMQYIESIAQTPLPVLVAGETGVGKELAALAVHKASGRSGEFVAVNVAAFDEYLFCDTLFGHEKGAFTGADKRRSGLIERASNGTLFLDEIGDLSLELQVRLLRLLQEKEYYPLGSDRSKESDARIVVATHCDLSQLVESGKFRRDLFYRLQYHQIQLPPLKKRQDDIPLLVDTILERAAQESGKAPPTYPKELITLLVNYTFPGNIRELQAMVYDAMGRHTGGMLSMEVFLARTGGVVPKPAVIRNIEFPEVLPPLDEIEGLYINEALRRTSGNQTLAANLLGISRKALNNRLHRL